MTASHVHADPAEWATVRVDAKKKINQNFIGFGFHVFYPMHTGSVTEDLRNEVLYKRWLELRPSFVRLTHQWGKPNDELVATMKMMQRTGTQVYLTTWNPKGTLPGEPRKAYAVEVADLLEDLRKAGCVNLRWYCMANELSLTGKIAEGVEIKGWASMRRHKETFADYHRLIDAELKRRKLPVGLVAMDASPGLGINEAKWARKHIDGITAAYGGHHYINNHGLKDLKFYDFFLGLARQASRVAPDKPYLIGEFGAKQHHGSRFGYQRWDGCAYYETDQEPWVAIQVSEAVLAGMNGGTSALAYWTFADFPDRENKRYINKWGTTRWSGDDHSARDMHYALALLTRYFRGPSDVLSTSTSEPKLRVSAVKMASGAISVVVLNRNEKNTPVRLHLSAEKPLRRYAFEIRNPPRHPFADLPGPTGTVTTRQGMIEDSIPALSLVVYTTDYDDDRPAAVGNTRTSRANDGRLTITWDTVNDKDLCYYRVFVGPKQVGSTIATTLSLPRGADGKVRVVAVDDSGNISR